MLRFFLFWMRIPGFTDARTMGLGGTEATAGIPYRLSGEERRDQGRERQDQGPREDGRHGILDSNLRPGRDGTGYKNSGHNADQPGVRASRDTVAENFASNADVPHTTYATSVHTRLRV